MFTVLYHVNIVLDYTTKTIVVVKSVGNRKSKAIDSLQASESTLSDINCNSKTMSVNFRHFRLLFINNSFKTTGDKNPNIQHVSDTKVLHKISFVN